MGVGTPTAATALQNTVANKLMHITVLWTVMLYNAGRWAVIEHPAITNLHTRQHPRFGLPASIWKTAEMKAVLELPEVQLHRIAQRDYSQLGTKPTFLLASRLPGFAQHLQAFARPPLEATHALVGRDASGKFRTAVAKEYPPALNQAMGSAFIAAVNAVPVATAALPAAVRQLFDTWHTTIEEHGCNAMGVDFAAGGGAGSGSCRPPSPSPPPLSHPDYSVI